jgi:predicted phosphodiesterase
MTLSRRQFIASVAAGMAIQCPPQNYAVAQTTDRFTFAEINDLHVSDVRSTAIVTRAVDLINADKRIQFTVVCGDLARDGIPDELKLSDKALAQLSNSYYTIPGNHDYTDRDTYCDVFGITRLNFVVDLGSWRFFGIDSREGGKTDATVSTSQIAWLRERLKETPRDKPIGLFSHHPFHINANYRVVNADVVLNLFSVHNLKIVSSGHFHGNKACKHGTVLFTTTACCSLNALNETDDDGCCESDQLIAEPRETEIKGFRLFHVDGAAVTTEFVTVHPTK